MPFPALIIGALVGLGGMAAVGGHISAKEKNEKAKSICDYAKRTYDDQVQETRSDYDDFTDAVSLVGESKEYLINNPVREFKQSLDMIKHLDIFDIGSDSGDLVRTFDDKEFDSMMAYGASLAHTFSREADNADAKGALFGALGPAAAALYGTGGALLSGAGLVGGLGAGFAAALTSPLAVIAAPIFLVSAYKADTEADANLEKARAYEAECKAECEKLKIQSDKFQAMRAQFLIYHGLMEKIGTIFEHYIKKTSKIINAHRNVLSKHQVKRTKEIFNTNELEIIKTSLNLFNTVKTLCMMNLVVENNGEIEVNSDFNEEFIDGVQAIADSHTNILS